MSDDDARSRERPSDSPVDGPAAPSRPEECPEPTLADPEPRPAHGTARRHLSALPPRVASAILARFGPMNDALIGDLLESYRSGRSRAWYWRQVLVAIGVAAFSDIRDRPIRVVAGTLTGWVAVALVLFVSAHLLNRVLGDWILDRLILLRYDSLAADGADTLVTLWAYYLRFLPAGSLAFLFGGWIATRVNRASPAATLATFILTALTLLAFSAPIAMLFGGWRFVPYTLRSLLFLKLSFIGVTGLLFVPALILLGSWFGTSKKRRALSSSRLANSSR